MEFENQLTDDEAKNWFQKLFGNIWNIKSLKEILYNNDDEYFLHYKAMYDKNPERKTNESELSFLSGFFGDSIWDVFSNNHTVFQVASNMAFEIGSWRGSGSFIADFIGAENNELTFSYMDFYMGHYNDEKYTLKSYEFIFTQLKNYGFDWQYAYPHIGVVDFSNKDADKLENYNPNKSLEADIEKSNFMKLLNDINEETMDKLQKGPLPSIILAYGKTFGKFPNGWIET